MLNNLLNSEVIMQQLEINGQRLNFISTETEDSSSGKHVVLLLPGFLSTIETGFGKVIEAMDKSKYTVVCWDPPGYGQSRPPDRVFERNFLERDAHLAGSLMKTLGHKKYSVVGWSHGGATGIHMAALFPEQVTSLVTLGTRYMFKESDLHIMKLRLDVNNWMDETLEAMLELFERDYLENLNAGLLKFVNDVTSAGGHYIDGSVDKVLCPTLIMNGKVDTSCPYLQAYYLQARIKNSGVRIIAKANHDAQVSHTEEFVTQIQQFLESPDTFIKSSFFKI